MLLPVTENITNGDNAIVGTLSNSASTSKFTKLKATDVGNAFVLLPANAATSLLAKGLDFLHIDVPALEEYFPGNHADINTFKFVTNFLLPYGTTTIKGSISDNSIGDTLCNISKTTGPLWSKLLLTWS